MKNIDWLIPTGTRAGLVGDNGAGKTTLLRILAGFSAPDDGTVEIPRTSRIGYLPQDLVELGDGSVMEFLSENAGLTSLKSYLAEVINRVSNLPEDSAELKSALASHDELEREFEARGG